MPIARNRYAALARRCREFKHDVLTREALDALTHPRQDTDTNDRPLAGIARHRDDISELPWSDSAEVITAEKSCRYARGWLERSNGTQARLHHRLKFENAMAEGKHPAIRPVRDLDVASRKQSLRCKDLVAVAPELPHGLTGQRAGLQFVQIFLRHLHGRDHERSSFEGHKSRADRHGLHSHNPIAFDYDLRRSLQLFREPVEHFAANEHRWGGSAHELERHKSVASDYGTELFRLRTTSQA
ncbi:MAG TPA: hypothetical protein VGY48_02850 [Vicinamibacterales bacterium]|nr:hypothetical protein [Vicinamibacterales bacterium]